MTATEVPGCYRHPGRETYVRCTRCDRYICPDCMRSAAVGQQCVQCVREGSKTVRQARTVTGARITTTAYVTYSLIALNVLAYLAELIYPGIVDRFDMLGEALMRGGTLYVSPGFAFPGYQAVGVAHGQWYRLITAAFLHAPPGSGLGILHIAMNMFSLWILGRAVEPMLGAVRFSAVYLMSALGGSVLFYLLAPDEQALGASGAIFGLVGAYVVISRRLNVNTAYADRLLRTSLLWLVASAWFAGWQAHLGGLLTGALIAAVYAYASARRRPLIQVGATAGLLALLIVVVVLKTNAL